MTLPSRTSPPTPPPPSSRARHGALRRLLWSEEQGRARTPWLIVLPLVGAYGALIVVELLFTDLPTPALAVMMTGAAAGAATALVMVSRRVLGARRGLTGYGLAIDRAWLRDLSAGLVLGVAAPAAPFLVGIATGAVTVEAVLDPGELPLWPGILLIVLACLFTGYWEELTLRGVFLRNAADGLRAWFSPTQAVTGAVVLSATVFGLAHIAQAQVPAFIVTWIVSGVVLGVVYVLSGNLALVIGAHITWNITNQAIFVRTDAPGTETLSAITRVGVDQDVTALSVGGLIEAPSWILFLILALLWLSRTRGTLRRNIDTVRRTAAAVGEPA